MDLPACQTVVQTNLCSLQFIPCFRATPRYLVIFSLGIYLYFGLSDEAESEDGVEEESSKTNSCRSGGFGDIYRLDLFNRLNTCLRWGDEVVEIGKRQSARERHRGEASMRALTIGDLAS